VNKIRMGWTSRIGLATATVAAAASLAVASTMPAAAAPRTTGTSATVVKVVKRAPIGKMLATKKGASLYTHPGGPCTGSCLSVWPALLMPKGTTTPLGASCLATVASATSGRLQVTYHGQALYTFTGDSGTSVNGNGVAGFEAAKVTKACP
jgi:predicted lipoprotein with Yx(FWY)xxD motif